MIRPRIDRRDSAPVVQRVSRHRSLCVGPPAERRYAVLGEGLQGIQVVVGTELAGDGEHEGVGLGGVGASERQVQTVDNGFFVFGGVMGGMYAVVRGFSRRGRRGRWSTVPGRASSWATGSTWSYAVSPGRT